MSIRGILLYLRKHYAIAASALVVTICLIIYFVRDEQIKRLEADYDDLHIRRLRVLKNFKYGASLSDDLEQLRKFDAAVEERLFNPEDLGSNKVYFYQRESATGVKLPTLEQVVGDAIGDKADRRARALAARSKYRKISYEMNVSGTYGQILNFMRHLEGGPAFYRLEGLSVASAAKNDDESQSISMRLGISILGKKQ